MPIFGKAIHLLCCFEGLSNFRWRPGVARPNPLDRSIAIDQGGGEAMRDSAALGLPVNGKRASKRIDVFFVSGCEGPNFGIGMVKRGVIAQNFRRIVGWIQRDA